MKKKIIIAIIIVLTLGIVGWVIFRGGGELPQEFFVVVRGDIVEEVSETGTVKPAEDVDLRFEISGTVERVYVFEGDEVKQGTRLVKLYTGKLYSQYLQAQASYNQVKAELDQLAAGSTEEEIQVAEQVVENARINLEDVKLEAENDLDEKYDDALVYLSNATSDANIALANLRNFEPKYFYDSSTTATVFRGKEDVARDAFFGIPGLSIKGAKDIIDEVIASPIHENIDNALVDMRNAIDKIKDALDYTREAMSESTLREKVTAADQATLDADISNINTALTNISTAQQAVTSQKITNQKDINSAENTLAKAKGDLTETKAGPRKVDIAVYSAKVDKARASVVELQQKLSDATLKAPIEGMVGKVSVKIGETVIAGGGEKAISLISASKFQIEVDIYEEDIVKVDTGDPVDISVIAFPDEVLNGKVISIDTTEKIIDGIVYYEVTVDFEELKQGIKPMMTADIVIKTAFRKDVLTVPEDAIYKKNGKTMVQVIKDDEIEDREIEVDLKGSDDMVEVTSGLEEGEKVVVE